jgi:antitoxin VapB
MAPNSRDPEVDGLAAWLAKAEVVAKTSSAKQAPGDEVEREQPKPPLRERLKPFLDEIASWPDTGVVIDKAFFDDLCGEDERNVMCPDSDV